jgi:hypothetical protein
MTQSKTPEGDTQSTRQDALRFLREATFNSLARVSSPRVDSPDTPSPKMIVSDLNDLDIKVGSIVSQFSFTPHGLVRLLLVLFASNLKRKNRSGQGMPSLPHFLFLQEYPQMR